MLCSTCYQIVGEVFIYTKGLLLKDPLEESMNHTFPDWVQFGTVERTQTYVLHRFDLEPKRPLFIYTVPT